MSFPLRPNLSTGTLEIDIEDVVLVNLHRLKCLVTLSIDFRVDFAVESSL